MPNDYQSKSGLIALKFLVEVNFDYLSPEFFGQKDWSTNFGDISSLPNRKSLFGNLAEKAFSRSPAREGVISESGRRRRYLARKFFRNRFKLAAPPIHMRAYYKYISLYKKEIETLRCIPAREGVISESGRRRRYLARKFFRNRFKLATPPIHMRAYYKYISLYKKEIETLRCIARASHDVVSWRRVRERDRHRFGATNE